MNKQVQACGEQHYSRRGLSYGSCTNRALRAPEGPSPGDPPHSAWTLRSIFALRPGLKGLGSGIPGSPKHWVPSCAPSVETRQQRMAQEPASQGRGRGTSHTHKGLVDLNEHVGPHSEDDEVLKEITLLLPSSLEEDPHRKRIFTSCPEGGRWGFLVSAVLPGAPGMSKPTYPEAAREGGRGRRQLGCV